MPRTITWGTSPTANNPGGITIANTTDGRDPAQYIPLPEMANYNPGSNMQPVNVGQQPASSSGSHMPSSGGHSSSSSSYDPVKMMQEMSQAQFEAYQKYRPQTAKTEFDLYSKYAPQYMKVQSDALSKLYPNQSGLGEMLAKDVTGRLSSGEFYNVPEPLKQQYQQLRAGADANRGMYRSGMSGAREATDLAGLGMTLRNQDTQTALQLYGGLPKATVPGSIPGDSQSITGTLDSNMSSANQIYGYNQQASTSQFNALLEAQIAREKMANDLAMTQYGSSANSSRTSNPWGQRLGEGIVDMGTLWAVNKWLG